MIIRITLISFNKKLINNSIKEFQSILLKNNNNFKIISLPIKIKKFCVIRSPHIDKDSREQFELRTYKKFIDILNEKIRNINKILNLNISSNLLCKIKII